MSNSVRAVCLRDDSWFSAGCAQGDWLGCVHPVPGGLAGPRQHTDAEAREMADAACVRGEAAACFELGMTSFASDSYRRPVRSPGNTAASNHLALAYDRLALELAGCSLDGGTACVPSARALDFLRAAKTAMAQEVDDANAALGRRCDSTDAKACLALARSYLDGASKDPTRGAALAQRACDLGESGGCFTISQLRAGGVGVPRDETRALLANAQATNLAVQDACGEHGNMQACLGTQKILANSQSVREAALAPDATRAACEAGDAAKCGALVRVYSTGTPTTPRDMIKAVEYLDKTMALLRGTCERGNGRACLAIAESMSRPGFPSSNAPPDLPGAAIYAAKGCNEGHDAMSCLMLAGMYQRGEGVPVDQAHAERCRLAGANPGAPSPGCR